MNEDTREILLILAEESSEVIKEVSKIMRFGPDQCKPGSNETNIQALEQELGDLQAMIELLLDNNIGVTTAGLDEAKKKKFKKLKKWSNLTINK
jgi:NTP pyrophosphatase (non-canonical NTP hydrolase)